MAHWTKEDLYNLDAKYAREGVHMHQRPFRAAVDLLGLAFSIGVHQNPEVEKIEKAYEALMPNTNAAWPGRGIGFITSVDRVKTFTLSVIFGDVVIDLTQEMGFEDAAEWWVWCRERDDIARASHFSFADAHDFSSGLEEIAPNGTEAVQLLKMAQSNLQDITNALPTAFSVDSIIQPICLLVELSIKGVLLHTGVDRNSLKGKRGHDLNDLAQKLRGKKPHRDDHSVALIASKLPPYVESRYSPAKLSRLDVVRLAAGAQFVAGSALRRLSTSDMALEMERADWPAHRPPILEM